MREVLSRDCGGDGCDAGNGNEGGGVGDGGDGEEGGGDDDVSCKVC